MHLTYPNSDPHIVTASSVGSGEAGAPEDEIEITPEMMEAGIEAFYGSIQETWSRSAASRRYT
jgi:hypothetical protein